jgi:putative peptidoglycan lipid II flippase
MFPRFAEAAATNDQSTLQSDLHRCLRFLWFTTLPIVAIFAALSEPVVSLLFQGGQFDKESVKIVTLALLFLVPQMFFYLGRELLARVFWSFKDTRTPFLIAVSVLILKGILDAIFVLILKMNVAGISLATTVVSGVSFIASAFLLQRKMPLALSALAAPLAKMLAASALAWLVASQINANLLPAMTMDKVHQSISMACAAGASGSAYFIACWLLRLSETKILVELAATIFQRFLRRR